MNNEYPYINKSGLRIQLCKRRKTIWLLSITAVCLSLIGIALCWLNPNIRAPLVPGLDFTGGTQIQLERNCVSECNSLNLSIVNDNLSTLKLPIEEGRKTPSLSGVRVQLLDDSKLLLIRLPFLSINQSNSVIESINKIAGPFIKSSTSIETIGPSLGGQLLKSSLISLLVAFAGIAAYISFRYDRRYAFLALIAVIHDVIIVCGLFAWLGLYWSIEVNSLFAVALLTIAGYSVNDTVVVFDRIRERSLKESKLKLSEKIDIAVNSTLTRTIYTSGTTLLPLIALIFFGGSTLYWFAIALACGVVVGSWSSIALAPTLLSLWESKSIQDSKV